MTLRHVIDFERGAVDIDEGEYLRLVRRSLRALIRVVENNALVVEPVLKHESADLLTLQRALCDLIHLAKDNGLDAIPAVDQAKELIRCRVLGCGLAGACNGVGGGRYPCPLKRPT